MISDAYRFVVEDGGQRLPDQGDARFSASDSQYDLMAAIKRCLAVHAETASILEEHAEALTRFVNHLQAEASEIAKQAISDYQQSHREAMTPQGT